MASTCSETKQVLSKPQIEEFLDKGVLVVENILSASELHEANEGLKRTLAERGVDTQRLASTGDALQELSSTNGSGGVLDLFYFEWKMKVTSNPRLFRATCQLWESAYCHEGETRDELDDAFIFKWHPYGKFDCQRGYMYIDRIGYRLPTLLAKQLGSKAASKKKSGKPILRSLTPHLDCCPDNFFSDSATKWRPIQCFVSLTDNLMPNTGGFEAAPGFHKKFHKWARPPSTVVRKIAEGGTEEYSFPAPCIGEYTHIRPKEDANVMARIRHIPVRAGSAVFWDNRIPHANSYRNEANVARAVVYCSFLPDIELNRSYVHRQLFKYKRRIPPSDQWINTDDGGVEQANDIVHFDDEDGGEDVKATPLRRKLVGLEPW